MRELPLAPMPGRGMEIAHLEKAPPPDPEELQALEKVWGHLPPEKRRNRRDLLLPALVALQKARGWISYPALAHVCLEITVPLADAYGVASFYGLLSVKPAPRHTIHVCDDVSCRMRGAKALTERLEQLLGPSYRDRQIGGHGAEDGAGVPGAARNGAPGGGPGEEGEPPLVGWVLSPCLGQCDRGPAAYMDEESLVYLTPEELEERIRRVQANGASRDGTAGKADGASAPPGGGAEDQGRAVVGHFGSLGEGTPLLLSRVGRIRPGSLEDYVAHEGYAALRKALAMGPEAVLAEVERSRLVGRGGAAFPAARKWGAVAREAAPRYIVCNADESEPGTFKDRILLEHDPFAVLEGMTIAAFAAGAEKGWLYLRGEYVDAYRVLSRALEEARKAGYLGRNILGSDFSFDIEIRLGAGAYVCGEETALFNSIEGYRGEPRPRPPYPTQFGLFGRPTVVNNVETLACVPPIVRMGGERYAAVGTERSAGTKLVSISGDVVRPGVYEVPFGIPLRTIIEELAGGVPDGGSVQAVLCGGAAGTFLTPEELDTPFTLEGLQAIGGTVGSGAMVVFGDRADLWDAVERIARFFMEESCGQCVPCRVGTRRQWEWVRAQRRNGFAAAPNGADPDAMLADLASVLKDASICGLGQLAPNALLSSLRLLKPRDGSSPGTGGG